MCTCFSVRERALSYAALPGGIGIAPNPGYRFELDSLVGLEDKQSWAIGIGPGPPSQTSAPKRNEFLGRWTRMGEITGFSNGMVANPLPSAGEER
jgi:hypothetical protein